VDFQSAITGSLFGAPLKGKTPVLEKDAAKALLDSTVHRRRRAR
jgi:hypothetical protein